MDFGGFVEPPQIGPARSAPVLRDGGLYPWHARFSGAEREAPVQVKHKLQGPRHAHVAA